MAEIWRKFAGDPVVADDKSRAHFFLLVSKKKRRKKKERSARYERFRTDTFLFFFCRKFLDSGGNPAGTPDGRTARLVT